jgi:hypothetical protein
VLLADVFVGSNVVKDRGTIDSDGKFTPSTTPDTANGTDPGVRPCGEAQL